MNEDRTAMFSKILVAVDNSECASRAFDYAARLSKLTGARISIIHVIPPVPATAGISVAKLAKGLEKEGEQLLANIIETRARRYSLASRQKLCWEKEILQKLFWIQERISARSISDRKQRMGGVKELLLGGVSHTVSNHATCPVLIVK